MIVVFALCVAASGSANGAAIAILPVALAIIIPLLLVAIFLGMLTFKKQTSKEDPPIFVIVKTGSPVPTTYPISPLAGTAIMDGYTYITPLFPLLVILLSVVVKENANNIKQRGWCWA